MTTTLNIIEGALRKIAVLGRGVTLSASDLEDARQVLNNLLGSLSAQGGFIYYQNRETFNLTNAQSYTIGSGGDFDTERPIAIKNAFTSSGTVDYALRQIDFKQYDGITTKDIGGIPEDFFYDANYPIATIYLYPKPTSVQTITITSDKQLTSFDTVDQVFDMPAEYEAMLIYNLAEWIAPEYEREAPPSVKRLATRTRNVVIAQNKKNKNYTSTVLIGNTKPDGNIYEGYFN